MTFTRSRKGVSYIVAVALVVMIAVLLSLILWGYMSDITEPLSYKLKSVEVVVNKQTTKVVALTYIGGKDSNSVRALIFKGWNSTGGEMRFYSPANSTHSTNGTAIPNLILINPYPGVAVYSEDCTSGMDHIIVVAEFSDGTKQVILDTMV